MLKILLHTIVLSTLSVATFADESCHIKTYSKIYITQNSDYNKATKLIKSDNCTFLERQNFLQFILNSNGSIHSSQASKLIKNLYKQDIKISPKRISIYSFKKTLKNNFNPNSNWHWNNIKLTSRESVIALNENESISFNCTNCEYSGSKNIKVTITNPISGTYKYEWLNGDIVIKTKALVSLSNLGVNNQALNKKLFHTKNVFLKSPETLFTNSNSLHFYKLNKPIKSGKSLSFRDLTPVNLVKIGQPTKVIIKNDRLSLSSIAKPMKSGRFGEMIQLRHPKTNKIIMGKVVDFNKVIVEL